MIRKFARIDASPDLLVSVFAEHARWTEWMPGVRRATLVKDTGASLVVDLVQHQMGHTFDQRVECVVEGTTVTQRQVSGFFKHWQAVWSFTASPGGGGTTVSCEMVVDLGMKGVLIPTRMMQGSIDRLFDAIIVGARSEIRQRLATGSREISGSGATLLEVFETEAGLEIWVAGRRLDIAKGS